MGVTLLSRTDDELLFKKSPGILWLFGGIFVAVGLLVIVVMSTVVTLECSRSTGQCTLERDGLFRSSVDAFPVNELQGARVGVSRSSDSDTYRVEFIVSGQTVPMTSHYSSGRAEKESVAQDVQDFLATPQQDRLTIRHDSRVGGFFFGLIFLLAGLISASFGRIGRIRFSISENVFSIHSRGLFGRKEKNFRLDEVETARVAHSSGSKGGSTYRVVVVFKNGREVPLTAYYSSGQAAKLQVRDAIAGLLRERPSLPEPEPVRSPKEDLFPEFADEYEPIEQDGVW